MSSSEVIARRLSEYFQKVSGKVLLSQRKIEQVKTRVALYG